MNVVTRRTAITGSAGLALAAGAAEGAPSPPADKRGQDMSIQRYDLTSALRGIPRISYAVVHGGLVHLAGVTGDLGKLGDVAEQTGQVLAHIDALLAKAGSDKSKL